MKFRAKLARSLLQPPSRVRLPSSSKSIMQLSLQTLGEFYFFSLHARPSPRLAPRLFCSSRPLLIFLVLQSAAPHMLLLLQSPYATSRIKLPPLHRVHILFHPPHLHLPPSRGIQAPNFFLALLTFFSGWRSSFTHPFSS